RIHAHGDGERLNREAYDRRDILVVVDGPQNRQHTDTQSESVDLTRYPRRQSDQDDTQGNGEATGQWGGESVLFASTRCVDMAQALTQRTEQDDQHTARHKSHPDDIKSPHIYLLSANG